MRLLRFGRNGAQHSGRAAHNLLRASAADKCPPQTSARAPAIGSLVLPVGGLAREDCPPPSSPGRPIVCLGGAAVAASVPPDARPPDCRPGKLMKRKAARVHLVGRGRRRQSLAGL